MFFCERPMPHLSPYPLVTMVRGRPWKIPHIMENMISIRDEEEATTDRPRGRCSPMKSRFFPYGSRDNISRTLFMGLLSDVMKPTRLQCPCRSTKEIKELKTVSKDKRPSNGDEKSGQVIQETNKTLSSTETHLGVPKDDNTEPWQFKVDLQGYDEVRAFTSSGMLTIEGHGEKGRSKVMIRHVTSLPPNVDPSYLEATKTKENELIVIQNVQSKELPIEEAEKTDIPEEEENKEQSLQDQAASGELQDEQKQE